MKEYYLKNNDEILKAFQVTMQGHSRQRAEALLQEKGPNLLQEEKKEKYTAGVSFPV